MKFNRISALLLAVCLLCGLCSCGKTGTQEKSRIAVITKATDSDFWNNVKKGVNTAATEYNVEVTFEGPEKEEDYISQNEMINRAVANGVGAIVLSAIDYYKSADTVTAAAAAGVKIVMIDSTVNSDTVSTFIGTDNHEAGRMAAEAAAKQFADGAELRIGILNCDESSDNGQQREAGIRSFAEQRGNAVITEVLNVNSNLTSATAGAITMLNSHPEINVIIGINEWMTLGIGNAIEQMGLSDKVCAVGFDSNVVSIGKLETGEIDALVVQNPFAMGYLGVQTACDLIAGKTAEQNIATKTSVITKENMFDESSQRILFQFE